MISECITAEEASLLAHEATSLNGDYLRAESNAVFNQIREAAEKGDFQISIDGYFNPIITKRLKAQKFIVTTESCRNEIVTCISWKSSK